ncbi:MAG: GEVED domain-containing protein [Bacteroidota bacterium]|nr:GEVED domain-containing protein [Bacteroidota bacterium]
MKKIYLSLALATLFLGVKAQVSNYGFTQFSDTYVPITGGTVFGNTTTDNQRFVDPSIPLGGTALIGPGIPVGFNFTYNGTVFDRIAVNANGWITFGQSTLTPNPVNMTSASYNNFISVTSVAPSILQNRVGALGRDLAAQTGADIRVETIGVTPNQTCVIQWTNYRKAAATGDAFNFQIRLSETSNNINMIYGTFTCTAAGTAQVGLRGILNSDFNNRDVTVTNPWATSIAGTFNTTLVNFNNTLTPASGQNYQWSPPPPCSGTPNSGTSAISTPSGCPNTNFTLTATGLSNALGLAFQWQSSSSASGPWNAVTSATNTSLVTNTTTTTYYQMVTTCTNSSMSATTSVSSYSIVNPGPCVCAGYGPSSANNIGDEEIFNVTFGSLNNTSNCTSVGPGPGSIMERYANYTGFIAAPQVTQVQAVPYSVDIQTCGGWFGMQFNIYIDFNQNGLFTDVGELVVNNTAAIQGVNSGIINIPITANVGVTRMRIVAVEGTVPGPTGTYSWGETEDYCIDILATTLCSGTPNSGTASISSATGCPSTNFTVTATGLSSTSGVSFQWFSSPSASGPWSAIPTETNTSYLSNTTTTTYYQLVSTCSVSALTATTSIVSFSVVNPGPCVCGGYPVSAATNIADEEILNVTFDVLNNTSSCASTAPGVGSIQNRYSNYTGFLAAPTVTQGSTVAFTVQIGTCGGNFNNSTAIYIDYNQNGSFSDPGEQVYLAAAAINGPHFETGNITIPMTAVVGTARMRVINVETATPAAITPSTTYNWGETEDYCIDIALAPLCSGAPSSGTAAISTASGCPNVAFNINTSGVTTGLGIQYQWYSSISASGPWSAITTATNTSYASSTTTTTYYQMVTTCTVSTMSATTSIVSYSVVNPGPCICAGYTTSSATSIADEEILNVTFSSLNSTSSCTTIAPGPGSTQNLYSNYVGFLAAPSVTQAQTVSFTVQIGTCGGSYGNSTAIYIDYNQNGSFLDAGEQAYLSAAAITGPHFETGNITIPLTATPGTTRMRVINVETSTPAIITPTGTYTWGETEDYCIDIALANLCSGAPASGTSAISTPTACPNSTVNLTATGLTAALGINYQWYSSPSASGPWSAITSATNTSYSTSTNVTTYYQLVTTCTVSSLTATTSIVSFSVVNPGPCVCNNYGISSATSTGDEEVWNVSFGALNNTSNCTVIAPGPGSALNMYGNYSGFVAAPTVMQGQNVAYGVNINTCGGWFGMQFDVYIDYNQNGLFTDAGEQVVNNTAAIQGNNTGLILIPMTASIGSTRMRIVAVEGTVPGPTGTYIWGETEDYCIDIIAPVPCAGAPNSGTAAISTNTGCITDIFNLNASGVTVATGITYQWYSATSSTGPWTAITNASNTAASSSASVTTFYQMVTTCSNSAQSATTSVVSYTPSNCYTMSNNTITACGGTIYDTGGLNSDYSANEDYTMTIVPSVANSSVILTFNNFLTESGLDYLDIYDGNSTSATLLGSYDGSTLPPVTMATNAAGVLTLHFYTDGSVEYLGFDISVTCTAACAGPPSAPAVTSMSICSGNTATLTAAATGTAQWYTTPTASTAPVSTSTLFVTPTLTGNATYYVRDTTACGASTIVTINITVAPTPTMNVTSTSSAVCVGQSATLTATSMNTYTWSTSATTSVVLITPTITTNYTVTGNDVLCSTTQTGAVSIGVNALPTVSMTANGISTICATNGSIALTGSPTGGVFSGPAVTGALLSIVNPGTFVPVYSYTNPTSGCSNTATTQVIVLVCGGTGVTSQIVASGFNLYPNPNTGGFMIETGNRSVKNINIVDVTGRNVYSNVTDESNILVNIKELANGIYYVKVSTDVSSDIIKVIKQ